MISLRRKNEAETLIMVKTMTRNKVEKFGMAEAEAESYVRRCG